MAMCEDYPCCGHTDGLGCDWVSPNEVVPCDVCIEARVSYPYHNAVNVCPTVLRKMRESVPANTPCQFFGEDSDCEGEIADLCEEGSYFCHACWESRLEAMREYQSHYDEAHYGY